MEPLLLAALIALIITWFALGLRRRRVAREAAELEARLRSRRANRVPVVSSNLRGSTPGVAQSSPQASPPAARTDRRA